MIRLKARHCGNLIEFRRWVAEETKTYTLVGIWGQENSGLV